MRMRSSTYRLFACLAVVALAGLPTMAAADEWGSCVKLSDDLPVAGCSRAIDSHQYTGRSPVVGGAKQTSRRRAVTSGLDPEVDLR
jgi:hypothetical protein